ncbi:MmgE/PrpD family protein [Streptomyces sp. NBC_00557]|uniref:MmgE/PrpD family protein n=1 Tax=Streptomyces sp. NBC_00557 TaxID=2975776 RepID=UPI002E814C91|nr:MmgE/PrpD family protein [Streptomyces sp. NBC_00557]WUC39498.1 MmgE/PrpD family protein [Streptomyces sp. NBC_00557]
MAGQTRALAAFVAGTALESLPDEVRGRLMQCLLDFVGVAGAGSVLAESSAAIRRAVRDLAAGGDCTVVGDVGAWPAPYAALLNETFAPSLDFDDTRIASGLHPGAAVIPAALAVAERVEACGAELLAALALGYEVCCRVGAALGHGAYHRGFHPTAIAGLFGGTAAAGRLLGLDGGRIEDAFGLAGSMAAGSMQYLVNGAENKRLHAGLAAHDAVLAATFAASGVRGAADAIEGELGLLHGHSHEPRAEALTAGLGSDWLMAGTGIKPYPSCRLTHGAVDAALVARRELRGAPNPGARVRLAISPAAATTRASARRRTRSGEPGTGLSWQLVRTTYEGLTDHRLPDRVADAIAGLASVPSVRTLLRDLRTPLIQEQP